jgi:hypothetical protein
MTTKDPVELFEYIVGNVRSIIDSENGVLPYFEYGHPLDISKRLDENATLGFAAENFPMVCLLLDCPATYGDKMAIDYVISPHILILHYTEETYHSSDRRTNVFVPTLIPIYNALITSINKCKYIESRNEGIKHDRIDRYFWGVEGIKMSGNESPVFNKRLDGIQIDFKDINVYKQRNC